MFMSHALWDGRPDKKEGAATLIIAISNTTHCCGYRIRVITESLRGNKTVDASGEGHE